MPTDPRLILPVLLAAASPATAGLSMQASLEGQASDLPARAALWAREIPTQTRPPAGRPAWIWQQADLQVRWHATDHAAWGVFTRQDSYLRGDRPALALAAAQGLGRPVDLSLPGSYQLQAQAWTLKASGLSLPAVRLKGPAAHLALEAAAFHIHDYQRTRVNATLDNGLHVRTLDGTLDRLGTRQYGLLLDERPNQGWGLTLNLQAQVTLPGAAVRTEVRNLASRLDFHTVHTASRHYRLRAENGALQIGAVPSVEGRYGWSRARDRLPAVWSVSLAPIPGPGWSVGWVGLQDLARPTASYTHRTGWGQWQVATVAGRQWRVTLQTAPGTALAWGLSLGAVPGTPGAVTAGGTLAVAW